MQLGSGHPWIHRMPSRTRNGVATTGTSGGVTAVIGGTLKIDPVAVGWASLNFRLIQAFDGSICHLDRTLFDSIRWLIGNCAEVPFTPFFHIVESRHQCSQGLRVEPIGILTRARDCRVHGGGSRPYKRRPTTLPRSACQTVVGYLGAPHAEAHLSVF